jgi:hypothetical protein
MRFMMMIHPNIADADWTPSKDDIAQMSRYNEELEKAGVLLSLDGLHAPSEGARIAFADGGATVIDGPFAEAKEVVGGYWMIQVRDRDEAVAWARRCPAGDGAMIEVRRVFELSDFAD